MRFARALGWLAATVVLTFQKWGFIPHDKPRLTVIDTSPFNAQNWPNNVR